MAHARGEASPGRRPINPESEPSDRSLLLRLQAGSETAATRLYFRYAKRLRALARASCSADLARRVDADDIVQSVFRVFFKAASQGLYDVPAGEDLWKLLLVIALNKIRAQGIYHQAAKRDVRITAELGGTDPSADTPAADAADRAFLELVVRDTLARLPASHRRMIELRLEGYEVAEIARLLSRSKRTVERGLQQARGLLSGVLQKDA